MAVVRVERRPDADPLRLECSERIDGQHEAHVDITRREAVFAQRAVQLVLRDAAARGRHDDGLPFQVGDGADRRIGLYDDAERRRRADARRDDPQRRVAECGRQHGQVAGRREIDRARALRLEQRRRTLEVGPAKPVTRAVEHVRGFRERAQAAGLVAEHERDARQVGAGRMGGPCDAAGERRGGEGGKPLQHAAARRGGGGIHRRGVLGDPRAGGAAAGQVTESVSGRQTSNRAMHIRAATAGRVAIAARGFQAALTRRTEPSAGTRVPPAPFRSAGARAPVPT